MTRWDVKYEITGSVIIQLLNFGGDKSLATVWSHSAASVTRTLFKVAK